MNYNKKSKYENIFYNISDISSISNILVGKIKYPVVCFYGEMGSGKTTLIKSMLEILGVHEGTKSPSYSIINIYNKENDPEEFIHLDCYRLNSIEEALDMGLDEILNRNGWIFIEWPDVIEPLLNVNRTEISLEKSNDEGMRILKMREVTL